MDIIGQWKLKKMAVMNNDLKMVLIPIEEAIKIEGYEEMAIMADAQYDFTAEGKMEVSIPIPEGATKEQLEEEGLELKNDRAIIETKNWKEENGNYLYDTEETREVFGETLSSWDKIEIEGSIMRLYNGGSVMSELEKL